MKNTVGHVISSLHDKDVEVVLEKKLSIPRETAGMSFNLQGGGTDGTYGYFILVTRGPSEEAMSYIHKIDLEAWETVKIR